jgi:hypothetical protein
MSDWTMILVLDRRRGMLCRVGGITGPDLTSYAEEVVSSTRKVAWDSANAFTP